MIYKWKSPIKVMVWVGLTKNGATLPYFVEQGSTIDAVYYCNRILPHAKREGKRLFGSENWVILYFFSN